MSDIEHTFVISRTSIYHTIEQTPPCDEAEKGADGRWIIRLSTLSDLIRLAEKYGELVFGANEIEIYDDYRE